MVSAVAGRHGAGGSGSELAAAAHLLASARPARAVRPSAGIKGELNMAKTYADGLREALALAYAKPTAFAFSVAAEIKELVDAEEAAERKRQEKRDRIASALAPRRY